VFGSLRRCRNRKTRFGFCRFLQVLPGSPRFVREPADRTNPVEPCRTLSESPSRHRSRTASRVPPVLQTWRQLGNACCGSVPSTSRGMSLTCSQPPSAIRHANPP
jgi:hypothetical protein